MNDLDRLPYLTPDQRRWMADQLSQHRPHAQIVVDFIDTFDDFCAGQPFSVLDRTIRSRIKNMMRNGKERDEILKRRDAMLGDDNDADMTLEDSRYRAKARKEIYERLRDIEWLFKTKKLSREERTQLKDEVSLLKARRQEIDAYERSENRQSSASPFFNVDYWINQGEEAEVDSNPKDSIAPATPKALPAPESEPPEPEWYEIDDAEHLTV